MHDPSSETVDAVLVPAARQQDGVPVFTLTPQPLEALAEERQTRSIGGRELIVSGSMMGPGVGPAHFRLSESGELEPVKEEERDGCV